MSDKNMEKTSRRAELIHNLASEIVGSAGTIVEYDDPQGTAEIVREVKERLTFETNFLLNETVTRMAPTRPKETKAPEKEGRTFERFGMNFRTQHMLMFLSVITLIITGMPLKFPELAISKFVIINIFGGLQTSTTVHRVGATGLIIVGVWHLLYIMFNRTGRRDFLLMIPRPRDIKDFIHTMLYYIGRKPSGPRFGRFSFIEKFDYWAVYWGMVVMIGSGSIMWFKQFFPKYLYDIGREAHSDEGLLATLAIIVWHFYNVHFNPEVFPMSWVWWHGRLTEEQMKHHHPLEYDGIVRHESKAEFEKKQAVPMEEGGAEEVG
ncbi:MAG TPA: cytochrome b/b6 domain-containing protein [candidate division Zixibacteria bacterium]|nr:cytochrome b/b6 domain-containing protein [candidate division Zixibacteria bacterium]